LGEIGAPKWSVRVPEHHRHGTMLPGRSDRQLNCYHRRWPAAVIRAIAVAICARLGWITLRVTQVSPPWINSGHRTMFTAVEPIWTPTTAAVRPCAAWLCFPPRRRDSLRLSNRCRWARHDGGHEFTAPAFFFIAGRQHSSAKLITTARSFYKLSPRPAPPHYHTPPRSVLLPINHQRAQIATAMARIAAAGHRRW
jgi:hypothetical protein